MSVDPVEVEFEPEPSREGHAHNPPDERVGVEVNPPVKKSHLYLEPFDVMHVTNVFFNLA